MPETGRRSLVATVVLLVAAAAALWASVAAVWLRPSYDTPFRGQVSVAVEGGEWEPALGPVALLALAGVAAAVATGGWVRRVVGVVLAFAGGWVLVLGARPQLGTGPGIGRVDAVADAPSGGRISDVLVIEPWTLLASVAGLLLLAAGGLLVLRDAAMPRLGARYTAPSRSRRDPDPERELWDSLDAGEDPTEPRH